MMARRDFLGDGLAKFFEQWMAWQVSGNAQRLPPHLAAGVAQFARRFHGVEHFIERQAGSEIFIRGGSPRTNERYGVGRPGAAFQIRAQERLDSRCVADFAGMHAGLQTERVRVGTRWKKSVRKLQQAKKSIPC